MKSIFLLNKNNRYLYSSFLIILTFMLSLCMTGCSNEKEDEEDDQVKEGYGEFSILSNVENGYVYDEANKTYTINESGEYTLSGYLDGRIVFASTLTSKCTLNLNNAYIETNGASSIYWASESKKIEVVCVKDSVNYIKQNKWDESSSSACIESENNIDINGEGTLNIISNQKHGIKGSDIEISGDLTINISANGDGIHGKSIIIDGSTLNISNCNDGIQAEVNSSASKGTIEITGGIINIDSCDTAIKVDTSITIGSEINNIILNINNSTTSDFDYPTDGLIIDSATVTVDGSIFK